MKASTVALPVAQPQASPPDTTRARTTARATSPTASMVRGALAIFSTQPVTWAATLVATMFVPRFLGDQGLGQYSVATAAATMAGVVAALGVPLYLRRQVAARPERAMIETAGALVLLAVSSIVLVVPLALVLPQLGLIKVEAVILQVALANMALGGVREVLFSLLAGREQHGYFAWLNAGLVVMSTIAGVGVLALGGGVTWYIVTQLVVQAVSMLPAWYLARVRLPRAAFNPRLWRQLVRGGAPFLGSGIALTIRGQMGVLIVGALLSTQVAGWYSAAQRIAGIPAFIPVVLSTPLFPVLSRIAADHAAFRQTLSRTLVSALILTMLPCAMVIGFAPVIPDLLGWQASFAPAIPVMMLLALFIPCMAANVVVGTALIAINRERQWLKVGAAAAVVNPVLCVAAIPLSQLWFENGAIGLAVAEVVTEAFMLAGVLLILPRRLIAPGLAWLSVRIVVAGIGAALTAMAVLPSSLILAVFASGLAYLVLIVGLRVVQLADVPTMRAAIREAVRPR